MYCCHIFRVSEIGQNPKQEPEVDSTTLKKIKADPSTKEEDVDSKPIGRLPDLLPYIKYNVHSVSNSQALNQPKNSIKLFHREDRLDTIKLYCPCYGEQ